MSEYLDETPYMARRVCPGCEPEADPVREILEVSRCMFHQAPTAGLDDASVPAGFLGSGNTGDSDGADCRAAAEALRRPR